MISTIGVVGFTPRPTGPEGGWNVTFVEEEHQAMKAMELFMVEQALIDYSKLSPSHKTELTTETSCVLGLETSDKDVG